MSANDNQIEIDKYLSAIEYDFKQFIVKKIDLNQLKAMSDSVISKPYHTNFSNGGYAASHTYYSENFKYRINNNFDDFTKNSDKYLKCFTNYLSVIRKKFQIFI